MMHAAFRAQHAASWIAVWMLQSAQLSFTRGTLFHANIETKAEMSAMRSIALPQF
jgi:hypothetical protein